MKAPRLPWKFLKSNAEPRRFNFKPIYYNEQKEALDKLVAEAEQKKRAEENEDRSYFLREEMRHKWARNQRRSASKNSFLRFAIIFITLLLIVFYALRKIGIFEAQ